MIEILINTDDLDIAWGLWTENEFISVISDRLNIDRDRVSVNIKSKENKQGKTQELKRK